MLENSSIFFRDVEFSSTYGLAHAPILKKAEYGLINFRWMSFPAIRSGSFPGNLLIRVKVKAFSILFCIIQNNLYKFHSKTMISMILQLLLIHQIFGQLVKCLQIMEPVRIIRTNVNRLLSILKSATAEMMLHLKHPTILFKLVQ